MLPSINAARAAMFPLAFYVEAAAFAAQAKPAVGIPGTIAHLHEALFWADFPTESEEDEERAAKRMREALALIDVTVALRYKGVPVPKSGTAIAYRPDDMVRGFRIAYKPRGKGVVAFVFTQED